MKFTFSMPPSINATYRGAGGRLVYTDVADAYVQLEGFKLNQCDSVPLEGDCQVTMLVYMRYLAKGDMHNNHKLILDLLEGHAYHNDRQVVDLHIIRYHDPVNPHVEVEVNIRSLHKEPRTAGSSRGDE